MESLSQHLVTVFDHRQDPGRDSCVLRMWGKVQCYWKNLRTAHFFPSTHSSTAPASLPPFTLLPRFSSSPLLVSRPNPKSSFVRWQNNPPGFYEANPVQFIGLNYFPFLIHFALLTFILIKLACVWHCWIFTGGCQKGMQTQINRAKKEARSPDLTVTHYSVPGTSCIFIKTMALMETTEIAYFQKQQECQGKFPWGLFCRNPEEISMTICRGWQLSQLWPFIR